MSRAIAFLDIHKGLSISIPEAELGSGKTLTAKWSELKSGNPTSLAAIGTPKTATAVSAAYSIGYTPTELATDLGTLDGRVVYLHLYDSVVWRDTFAFRVTQVDEDVNAGTP